MYNIQDRFYLSIKFDGKEMPLDVVTFKEMTMNSSIHFGFPIATLLLSDSVRYFDSSPLVDGTTVEVSSGSDFTQINKPVYKFRIFKVERQERSNVMYYTIQCIFNAPRYINENVKGAYQDSTSSVIKDISSLCGFTSEIDTTTDTQVWYGNGQKRFSFAQKICKASYLNNNSYFELGLTLNSVLKLKNISAINLGATKNIFVKGNKLSKDVVSVLDDKESTNSGFQNNIAAYKMEGVEQTTDGFTNYNEIQLSTKSSTVNVNSVINSKITGSSLKMYPVSSGNTHSNFYSAMYQNLRIKSTYGSSLFVMINQESNVDLFDPVKYACFDNVNGEVKINNKLSGGYIVTGKAVYIVSGAYYEKLLLTRQGYNLSVIDASDKKILGIN